MYHVRSIRVLYPGDLNYVTSVYRKTLRSFAIQYNEVFTCSKSATETPNEVSTCSKSATESLKQDSEYVLVQIPREQRTKVKNPSLTLNLTKFSSWLSATSDSC